MPKKREKYKRMRPEMPTSKLAQRRSQAQWKPRWQSGEASGVGGSTGHPCKSEQQMTNDGTGDVDFDQ